jgi:hypothetical protein
VSPPAVAAPVVTSVKPNVGATTGGTAISISGSSFQFGARVTIDGVEAPTYPVDSSNIIRLFAPAHQAGTVDVAVINPDGQNARVIGGFSYQDSARLISPGPRPSITSVTPSAGITGGGTDVLITGTDILPGATVTLGGVVMRPNVVAGSMSVRTLPHPAEAVDVVVTNPDGQSTTIIGAYTFAEPESLNFNGRWEGRAGDHWDYVLSFTIENDVLTRVSCDGQTDRILSAPPSTSKGVFSAFEAGVSLMSGQFFSSSYGTGILNIRPCDTHWEAWKQDR